MSTDTDRDTTAGPDTNPDTSPDPDEARRGRLRGRLAVVVAAVLLVAAAVVAGPGGSDEPFDPDGVGPLGLRGLVETLDRNDVFIDVSLEPPVDTSTTLFVPVDRLSTSRREALLAWVADGGRLVVADAGSPLHELSATPAGFVDTIGATTRDPACDLLPDVADVTHAAWIGFEVPDEARDVCFPLGEDHAWLVSTPHGRGEIVALGSAEVFTNGLLDADDHAVLAAALLAPAPGDRVQVVPRPELGEGETTLLDLVAPQVWHGLGALLAAVVVAALARGRRLGRPVPERLPPVLPSIELTNSLAHLLQRAGRPDAAAERLRSDARAIVATAVGLPIDSDPARLADAAEGRLGVAAADARLALVRSEPVGEAGLVELQQAVLRLRRAATRLAPEAAGPDDDVEGGASTVVRTDEDVHR